MEQILLRNPSVGEILKLEFLEDLGMSEQSLAEQLGVSCHQVVDIVQGKSVLTADMDLRLCRYFGLSEGYFLRLQNAYDLLAAKRDLGETLDQITPIVSLTHSKKTHV
jgi:addiction module HigA family antidote